MYTEFFDIDKAWKRVIRAVRKKPNVPAPYPDEVVKAREFLSIAQVLLGKYNVSNSAKEKVVLSIVFEKTMKQYKVMIKEAVKSASMDSQLNGSN